MAQSLFYTPSSGSLVLIKDPETTPFYWYDVSKLEISASAYDAQISGSDFGGTVASARIYAYSGSVNIVSFPLEETNLYYPPFPDPIDFGNFYPIIFTTSSFNVFSWEFNIDTSSFSPGELSGSSISIFDLTESSSYISSFGEYNNGGFTMTSGNNYLIAISGSGSYDIYFNIFNVTSGSTLVNISSSNSPVTYSFTPLEFNDYSLSVSITGPPV